MSRFLTWLGLPPLGSDTALHIDLATALIALLALIFSIWTWRHQTRLIDEDRRIERDNGLIRWIDGVIDTIVESEFFLRGWLESTDAALLANQRSTCLAKLAAAIDKGRLYFPTFTRDVTGDDDEVRPSGLGLALLDHLVTIYDLVKNVDLQNEASVKAGRHELMITKRHFVMSAQDEVEPERRLLLRRRKIQRAS
jgi:hypothetical protein